MKRLFYGLLMLPAMSFAQIGNTMHCGFDFTSYFVVHPHEDGKSKTIDGLRISISDESGKDIVNMNNFLSWQNGNKPLVFSRNYKIDNNNKRIPITEDGKWFYYFADDHYLLSISNTFPAESYFLKIEDVDGEQNGGIFKTQIIPLASYNMYVLCSAEERDKIVQFGRRMNKPIDVVMDKE
nr:hypothetical protein [uncultured Flavobacterium sp.]